MCVQIFTQNYIYDKPQAALINAAYVFWGFFLPSDGFASLSQNTMYTYCRVWQHGPLCTKVEPPCLTGTSSSKVDPTPKGGSKK